MRSTLICSLFIGSIVLSCSGRTALAVSCTGVHPVNNTQLRLVQVATGINRPEFVAAPPGDFSRIFVIAQTGKIWIHRPMDAPGVNTQFLDISARISKPPSCDECGLLGIAFDPDYATNGYFYLDYTDSTLGFETVVSRFTVSATNPDLADGGSELRLLRIPQPETNHNGGWIGFGPDGYLYVAMGDGGGEGDQHGSCGNGQNTGSLLGKMLRIDPRNNPGNRPADCGGTTNYRIPANNPLVGTLPSNCEEIYDWGLRNPWRNSFDDANGDFYIADVGQACQEEINYATAQTASGKNYGWRQMEGRDCFDPANPGACGNQTPTVGCPTPCRDPSLTLPLSGYGHSGAACAIVGGYVYRGCQMPNFRGKYFYGDYCAGFIKSLVVANGNPTQNEEWTAQLDPNGDLASSFTSFGFDARGEIYVADRDGVVSRFSPPFTDLEVAGDGVATSDQFLLTRTAWTWENLQQSSWNPVTQYRVYRSATVNGAYACVLKSATTTWPGGDPQIPSAGTALYYLVVAVNAAGETTRSSNPLHALIPGACP